MKRYAALFSVFVLGFSLAGPLMVAVNGTAYAQGNKRVSARVPAGMFLSVPAQGSAQILSSGQVTVAQSLDQFYVGDQLQMPARKPGVPRGNTVIVFYATGERFRVVPGSRIDIMSAKRFQSRGGFVPVRLAPMNKAALQSFVLAPGQPRFASSKVSKRPYYRRSGNKPIAVRCAGPLGAIQDADAPFALRWEGAASPDPNSPMTVSLWQRDDAAKSEKLVLTQSVAPSTSELPVPAKTVLPGGIYHWRVASGADQQDDSDFRVISQDEREGVQSMQTKMRGLATDSKDPSDAAGSLLLLACYLERHELFDEAAAVYTEVLKLNPGDFVATTRLKKMTANLSAGQ